MTKAKTRWFCVNPECTFYTSKLDLSIEHQGIDKDIAQARCEHEPLCLPPEELLLGDNKPISSYQLNDSVVGINGLEEVKNKFVRPYQGDLIEIKVRGMLPFKVTPEHPVLAIRGRDRNHGTTVHSHPVWIPAKELQEKHSGGSGDYLIMPKINGSVDTPTLDLTPYIKQKYLTRTKVKSLILDKELAWILGLYVAEGHSVKDEQIVFSLNSNESDIRLKIEQYFKCLGHLITTSYMHNEQGMQISIGMASLSRAFPIWCGKGAVGKQIPDFVLYNSNNDILEAFLEGYISGDGHHTSSKHKEIKFSTVSPVLARQLQLAYARLEKFVSLRKINDTRIRKILGRTVREHANYGGSYYSSPVSRYGNKHWDAGNFFYMPVAKISKIPYSGSVYNIETRSNTFLASNVVVHNCHSYREHLEKLFGYQMPEM